MPEDDLAAPRRNKTGRLSVSANRPALPGAGMVDDAGRRVKPGLAPETDLVTKNDTQPA